MTIGLRSGRWSREYDWAKGLVPPSTYVDVKAVTEGELRIRGSCRQSLRDEPLVDRPVAIGHPIESPIDRIRIQRLWSNLVIGGQGGLRDPWLQVNFRRRIEEPIQHERFHPKRIVPPK